MDNEQPHVDSTHDANPVEAPTDPLMDALNGLGFSDEQPEPDAPELDDLDAPDSDEDLPDEDQDNEDFELDDDADEVEPDLTDLTVTIGDETLSVEDLKQGYLRQADYTRKTQEIAEKRREVEQQRDQYAGALAFFSQQANASLQQFQGVDWDQLKQGDPAQYQQTVAQYQRAQQTVDSLRQQQGQFMQAVQADVKAQQQAQARESVATLKTLVPEWSDTLYGELRDFSQQYGMSAEEFNQIADHRPILMMLDAMRYRKNQSVAAKKKAAPVQSVRRGKSGQAEDTVKARDQRQKLGQFRQSRTQSDAARVLEQQMSQLFR